MRRLTDAYRHGDRESFDEFLTRLDAGELDMDDDEVLGLVMLEPFAR